MAVQAEGRRRVQFSWLNTDFTNNGVRAANELGRELLVNDKTKKSAYEQNCIEDVFNIKVLLRHVCNMPRMS